MISLVDVRFRYRAGLPWAVDGVSFALKKGEVLGLLGPNGAGKTTLMALIAGLRAAQGGEIRRGVEVEARGGFALVPQEHAFYPMLSCRENLEFFAGVLGMRGARKRERVSAAIEAAGLAQVANRRVSECSGGLKRRLNLAIGLAGDPQLLLLDEPTVGVDPQSRAFLLDAVRGLRARGKTIIYTSHYMEEAQAVSDRVAIIDHGRLLCCGTLAELLADARGRLYVRVAGGLAAGAREALAALGLLGGGDDGGAGWLEFAVDAEDSMERVLGELRRRGARVMSVQFGSRHLEDVFLRLTHRLLRD
ncbi:MAG: ABC transporter ATP-binding protein [Opitutaceae bacterium]|nr:ABC transporter ATP-binding protein [Opitutaceae bacterium]